MSKSKQRLSKALIITGALMLAACAVLMVWNVHQSNKAHQAVQEQLPKVESAISQRAESSSKNDNTTAPLIEAEKKKMPVVEIDGNDYIGYITIATLGMKLPVMNTYSDYKLNIAPCRYYGSLETDDLVIAGHNFASSFEKLTQLKEGDEVRFTNMNGQTYVYRGEELRNELLQLDKAQDGSYGPVYDCDGKEIEFCPDKTACRNISIESNIFKCDGFPAIGHHDDCGHENIVISNNIFDGSASGYGKSRGYIIFMPSVSGVKVVNNSFFAPEKSDTPNIGIISENSDRNALVCEENSFHGYYSEKIFYGDTSY